MSKTEWIALLRGINVGGHNKLPMKPLCAALADAGFLDPRYYIQSGNLVFSCAENDENRVQERLATTIKEEFLLSPEILVLSPLSFAQAIADCPYSLDVDPKTLHFLFLADHPPAPDWDKIKTLRAEDERFEIIGKCAYLLAPSGIGRSKLMAAAERLIKVPATARNLRTVKAIQALCTPLQG